MLEESSMDKTTDRHEDGQIPGQDRFGTTGRMLMRLLGRVEDAILYAISAVLIVAMVALLVSASIQFVQAMGGDLRVGTLRLLDSVLLVMMMVEILSTISISLRLHTLAAEQFLIIGLIAAIRRILVITAEQTELLEHPDVFTLVLYELALLGVLVLILAGAIYMLNRSKRAEKPGGVDGAAR
jgi:uncharacterized membrane protein (DUF373 family)